MKQHLLLFRATVRTIGETLQHQPRYLQEHLVEECFQVRRAKACTQETGTPSERFARFGQLKDCLFKQVFAQLYTTRTVNLVATL